MGSFFERLDKNTKKDEYPAKKRSKNQVAFVKEKCIFVLIKLADYVAR